MITEETKKDVIEYARQFEFENWESFENWQQYAYYCNHVLPHLRMLAGYEDSGAGTYQECPDEETYWDYDEIFDIFTDNIIILEEDDDLD